MTAALPKTFLKLKLEKFSYNFREAVIIVSTPLVPPDDNVLLVKNKYVGVNATDVNVTAGRFYANKSDSVLGLEGVGVVVQIGKNVDKFAVGQCVAYFCKSAYAEYVYVSVDSAYLIPEPKPEYISLIISGLTAAIGLDKSGKITEGETVLITAAAGGCGHIAVQWAKAAGCHVIGTCSSEKKEKFLKDMGCDRIVNYKKEKLDAVLVEEYPKGVDVIWETIGGEVFETCLRHLAVKGRLLIIGYISGYKTDVGCPLLDLSLLPRQVLSKSASVQGFILYHYSDCYSTYFTYLRDRIVNKELHIAIDNGIETLGEEFVGVEGIIKAVEHLHSGNSFGKVTVRIP